MTQIRRLLGKGENYECLFDDDINTCRLSLIVTQQDYLQIIYSSGDYVNKTFARVLLNAPKGMEVDHINGNSLDNRRINLRLVTRQQNRFNIPAHKNKKSGLPKGVTKKRDKYQAKLMYNHQTYSLGCYHTIEGAEAAYLKKAEELQGEFAVHNSRGRI